MNERATELLADFKRYMAEAGAEWAESIKDSPPSHVYTLLAGALVAKVIGWIL